MINDNDIYKIKDSVDLFLSNENYILAYFMNTRQRKSFRVNKEAVHLLECIDGTRNLAEIKEIMQNRYNIVPEYVNNVIKTMENAHIITKIKKNLNILSKDELQRYSRQINYFGEFLESEEKGIEAQKNIINSTIIIFGIGAVGGNIAIELAMAGVGKIILYDFDKVEVSDACRHMYFKEEYINANKTVALKKELEKINKNIKVEIIQESMKPETKIENLIKSVDFVVNTMDEPYIGYTAAKISRVCVKYKIAHYIAGGFDAHLASTGELIIPYVTPCVECYAKHFKETLKDWKPKKHPVKNRYREIGGLASMSLFSSSYACIEIIKYIAGLVPMEKNFKVRGEFLFPDMSLTYLNVEKNPNCPVCGGTWKYES